MKVMIYVYLNRKKEKKIDCTRLAIENHMYNYSGTAKHCYT